MVLIANSVFPINSVCLHSLKQILKQDSMQKDCIKGNAHVTEGEVEARQSWEIHQTLNQV